MNAKTPKAASKTVAAPADAAPVSIPTVDPYEAKLKEIAEAAETLNRHQREYEQMIMAAINSGSNAPRVA
jgi:hypothetical protein